MQNISDVQEVSEQRSSMAATARILREKCKGAGRAANAVVSVAALAMWMLAMPGVSAAQSTTLPEPVVASATTTVGTGLNQPQGVGVDSNGNVFVASASNGNVIEFPANGGPSVTLMSGLSYNKGLAVDSLNNVYSTSYSGAIYKWAAGGAANSGTTFATGSTCPDWGGGLGYYIGFYDLSADAKGNIYSPAGQYILEFNQTAACTERLTPTQLPSAPSVVAADPAGDLYYAIGNNIYYSPVGGTTTTELAIPAGAINTVNGLTVDANGDLFITDVNAIEEIFNVNGTLDMSSFTYLVPSSAPFNIGISDTGVLYYPNFNANSVLRSTIGSMALGSSAVGTAGTAGTLTYTFNAAVTPTAFNYVSGPSATTQFATVAGANTTCAAGTPYVASTAATPDSCTLSIAMTAATPGKVTGAVQLQTATGTLATTNLSGVGNGAALVVNPGTQTSLGKFTSPSDVAVDGSGNVFVADAGANSVTEFPAGGGAGVPVGTGFNAPQGVAVDAAGDLFVSDTGNDRIVEVPVAAGVLNTAGQTVLASATSTPAINAPLGVAVDTNGDVLVANSGAGNVVELPNEGGVIGQLPAFTVGTGFTKPTAIAVDAGDNIFVADATAGKVFEVTPLGAQTAVLGNYSQMLGLVVDANDDIFLTQTNVPSVTKVSFVGGAYATNSTTSLGAGLVEPEGLALDAAGDLYVADSAGAAAYAIQRTLGALSFGKVNVGETSAAQTLTVSNPGNAALTFSATPFTVSGDSGDFAVSAASSNGCGTTLATGSSCGFSATFTPTASGARTATVSFASNAANAATIGATLSGTGASSVPTTLTLGSTPSGTANFGQSVTVTATVAPQTASSVTPTGTVQFIVDGNPYGNPVTLSSGTTAGTGTASVSLTGLGGGAHTIDASYSGDNTYASSSAGTALSLTIATAPTTTALTATINSTTITPAGTSVTFTATVTPNGLSEPPYPSGTVSFYANGSTTALGTAALTNGVATFTTTALPNGQYGVAAVYSGDVDFASSTSTAYDVYVSPPTFILSGEPTALTVPAHGSASATFTLTPIAGYQGAVFYTCSGLPAEATCSFTPGGVEFLVTPGAQTVTMTVNTGVAPALAETFLLPSLLTLGGLFFFRRKLRVPRVAVMMLVMIASGVACLGLSGCGSGSHASPAGSSTVTVTLTGTPGATNNITQTFTFSLKVQ